MLIRDIHKFNESIPDKYMKSTTTINQSFFYTLPVVDGFNWGKKDKTAGLQLMVDKEGVLKPVQGGKATSKNDDDQTARVHWPSDIGEFKTELKEKTLEITCNNAKAINWYLHLNVDQKAQTPLKSVSQKDVVYEFDGHTYKLSAIQGQFENPGAGTIYRLKPQNNTIVLSMHDK